MRFSASDVARSTGGDLVGADVAVDGATIDSRSVRGGELFVPIIAERDGHDFIGAAMDAGAAAHFTSRPATVHGGDRSGTAIVVPDTGEALLALGGAARARLPDRVAAITGSVGKTTAKDLLRGILRQRYVTAASERSFNNELGVPLTLVNADDATEAAVIEMGARGPGHISLLCSVARPTLGIVTVVAGAHLEMFGSIDEVALAKGELVEALPGSGTAVLNADDARVLAMAARTSAEVVTFGESAGDVRAEKVILGNDLRPSFRLCTPNGSCRVDVAVRGRHNVTNALAAAAAALASGCSLDDVTSGLAATELSSRRMDLITAPSRAHVLDDSYNANPTSMKAALDSLAAIPAERRIAILGEMAELGRQRVALHQEVADYAAGLGIRVIAVAAPEYGAENADGISDALTRLGAIGPGDAVLAKGSLVAGMDRVVKALLNPNLSQKQSEDDRFCDKFGFQATGSRSRRA